MEDIHPAYKKHLWALLVFFAFIMASYFIISSQYRYLIGDAGIFARSARIFFEEKRIDISHSGPVLLGQFIMSNIFCALFGFTVKTLHISAFVVNFFLLLGMYFFLLEWGTDRFLALFGSLTLFVNPIALCFLGSYYNEPFFMCYLVFSLLFFLKGLRHKKYHLLYLGGILGGLAVLTRQYAVSVSVAVIIVSFFYWKKDTLLFVHTLISAILPLITIGLFYTYLYFHRDIQGVVPLAYTAAHVSIFLNLTHPMKFFSILFFDSVVFLHYSALYLTPLCIILFFPFLKNFSSRLKFLFNHKGIFAFSLFYVCTGTFLLFLKYNRLMPYTPSIFSIGRLTRVFSMTIAKPKTASIILTIFSATGSIIILFFIVEYFFSNSLVLLRKKDTNAQGDNDQDDEERNKIAANVTEKEFDPAKLFFYLWGIVYFFLSSILILRYDRYVYPFSLLGICLILGNFSSLGRFKKTFISVFVIVYCLFIFDISQARLAKDLQWEAGEFLMEKGIASQRINACLGFNNFYSFHPINDFYKNVGIKQPVNWHLFHPMADFFVTGNGKLKHEGLEFYKEFSQKRLFGLIKGKQYIYKRKEGYRKPVLL